MRLLIIFGTETGNSEFVADEVGVALSHTWSPVEVCDMAEFDVRYLKDFDIVLVICSTYGEGELPASALLFYDALLAKAPDLTGVSFAAFGLGDSSYETFNNGSTTMSTVLSDLGASRIGPAGSHDASSAVDLADAARAWADELTPCLSRLGRDIQ